MRPAKPLPAVILRYNPFNVSFLHFICPCHLHSPHSPSLFPLFSDPSSPPPTSIRSLSLQTADHVQSLDMPFMPSGGFRGHGVRRLIVIRHNGLASGFIFIKKCSNFFFFNALKKRKKLWRDQSSSVYTLCVLHALFIYSVIHKQRPKIFCLSHPTLFSGCPLSLHFTLLHPVSINLIYPPCSNFFPLRHPSLLSPQCFLSPKTPPLATPGCGSRWTLAASILFISVACLVQKRKKKKSIGAPPEAFP